MLSLALWAAIAALSIVTTLPFAYEYARGNDLDSFAPIFWAAPMFFLMFGARAALRILRGDLSFRAAIPIVSPRTVMLEVLVVAIVGLVVLCMGYYWRRPRSLARRLPTFRDGWSSRRAWAAIAVLVGVGLAGCLGLRGAIGTGPRSSLAKGSSKFAFIAVNMLNTASILALADVFVGWPDDRLRPSRRAVVKAAVAAAVVAGNALLLWQLGGRGRAFGIVIVAVFLFHYLFRRLSFPAGMGFFAVVKVLPGWVIGIVTSVIALDFAGALTKLTNPFLFTATPYTRLNNVVVIFAGVPDHLGYQGGVTFASAFFELVPVEPFSQTQVVFGRLMGFSGQDIGAPITLLGELYLNLGLVGVVVGLFVMRAVLRIVYDWLVGGRPTAASLVLFSILTNSLLLWGNFLNAFPKLGVKVLPMIVVLAWVAGGVRWPQVPITAPAISSTD